MEEIATRRYYLQRLWPVLQGKEYGSTYWPWKSTKRRSREAPWPPCVNSTKTDGEHTWRNICFGRTNSHGILSWWRSMQRDGRRRGLSWMSCLQQPDVEERKSECQGPKMRW